MKIRISDLGPIHHFEYDLDKDFHFIVGPNNVGKSYAMTVVYLLLKSLMEAAEAFDPFEEAQYVMGLGMAMDTGMMEELPDWMFVRENGKEAGLETMALGRMYSILNNDFLKRFQRHFEGTHGPVDAAQNAFSEERPEIKLLFHEIEVGIGVKEGKFGIKRKASAKLGPMHEKVTEELDAVLAQLPIDIEGMDVKGRGRFRIKFALMARLLYGDMLAEIMAKVRSIHYLPASRSGLYQGLSGLGRIVAELAKSRASLGSGITLPGISVPQSDYFLELSKTEADLRPDRNDPIDKITRNIEERILGGSVEFDGETSKIFYTPHETTLKLDIGATSSMVSELSPIVCLLRHVSSETTQQKRSISANAEIPLPKPILFMEEPEAHLHLENQVKLMGAFADLIRAGVKITLTSHSDYLFHKLNNLILEKRIDVDAIAPLVFKRSAQGSEAVPLTMDELGIEDDNFLETTEKLYEEKGEIIERINADAG